MPAASLLIETAQVKFQLTNGWVWIHSTNVRLFFSGFKKKMFMDFPLYV